MAKGQQKSNREKEEAQARESKTGHRRFAVFHSAAEDHNRSYNGQE